MNACTRSSSAAPLGADDDASRGRPRAPGRRASADRDRSGSLKQPRGSTSSAPSSSSTIAGEVRRAATARRRTAARASISCSATQRSSWSASASSALGRVGEVGRDEQQPRGRLGLEHRELVLAEHAAGEEAGDRAGLDRQHAARGARRAGPCPGRPVGAAGSSTRAHRAVRFASIQPGAVDRLGAPARARRRPGRCRRRRAARPPRRARRSCSNGAGSPAGCRSATPACHGPGELPVDHVLPGWQRRREARPTARAGTRPRSASPSRRARGDHRRVRLEVERRGQRVVVGGERDRPPASRTISCAAAASTARQRFSDAIAVEAAPPRPGTATTAIAPIARSRCAASASASADCATQRGSADSTPSTSSLPSRVRRSPSVGSSGTPSSCAPRAAPARPTPRRARSRCTKPNTTSAIVGAVGDGDRERVVRQPALGVERAVDRVDHHEQRPSPPKSTDAALLADRGEARARRRAARSSSAKTASSAASSITSVRSPPSPRVPVSRHALGDRRARRRASSRSASAAARHAPSQSVRRRRSVAIAGLSYGGARRADLRPARGRRAPRRPAARPRRRGHRQDDRRWSSASPGWRRAGAAPEALLALTLDAAAADALRERLEDRARRRPTRSWRSRRSTAFCARLLRDEALEAGLDPFADAGRAPPTGWRCCSSASTSCRCATTTCAATRARCSARSSRRIDRLKDELVTRRRLRAPGRRRCRERRRARARASASSPRSTPPTTACSPRPGALDFGDLVLHAFRLLREKPHVRARLAARYRHVLVDELQDTNFAQGLLLRLLVAEHGNVTRGRRRRPGDPPLPRRGDEEHPRLPAPSGRGATVVRLERVAAAAGARMLRRRARRRRADRGPARRRRCAGAARRRRGRVLALRQRARAGAGRRRRGRAADRARGRRARGRLRARALGARARARRSRVALEERAVPVPAGRRGGVLPARRGARPARLAAAARRPGRRRRGRARARAAAGRAARDRPRARAPRSPAGASSTWSRALGAALESPQIPPEARERIAHVPASSTARPPRALDSTRPDLYVHRLIERLGLRRQLLFAAHDRGRRAAASTSRKLRRARAPPTCAARRRPRAREFARSIAAVADAGPARGGGGRRRARRAACR